MQKKIINFERTQAAKKDDPAMAQLKAFEKLLRVMNSQEWEANLVKLTEINFNIKETIRHLTPEQKSLLIKSALVKDDSWKQKFVFLDSVGFTFDQLSELQHFEAIKESFYFGKQKYCNQTAIFEKLSFLQAKGIRFSALTAKQQAEILITHLPHRIEKIIKFLQLKENLSMQDVFAAIYPKSKFLLIRENFLKEDFLEFLVYLNTVGLKINDLTTEQKKELIKAALKFEYWEQIYTIFSDMQMNFANVHFDDQIDILKLVLHRGNRKAIIAYLHKKGFAVEDALACTALTDAQKKDLSEVGITPKIIKTIINKLAK
jgi:hypothetical protein